MISHPNVVRVENFFRANETCYMVLQYVRGRTLQFHIQRNRHEFTEAFIRRVFTHLMNGLREVHARKLLHLDIKPANIFISMEGRPVLLDFGAARITLSEEAMKLKPMYTAGFAAPEHYRFKPEELGPWSDIYSVGATIYTCIAGTPPQAGDAREEKDRMIPLRTLAAQHYSDDLYDIVESCLAVDHLKRPQTAFDLQKRLMEEPPEVKPSLMDTLERPRTTCVACIVQGGRAYWAHAGDSRLYVLRRGTVVTATQDHSRVQQMIDAGEITEEAAARHPDRNKIYSCLGGVVPPQITTGRELALEAEDTILLSTDGFWSQIPASILGTMLRKQTVVELMPGLLSEAHRRAKGESDNLSVVAMTW